jgi:hypothetical protein
VVAPSGSTAAVLSRSLLGLRDLIDRSLAEVRLDAGTEHLELINVSAFIEAVEIGAVFQAQALGLHFVLTPVEKGLIVEGDRQILFAALANLLQNAFKFTRKHSCVSLTTRVTEERVLFEVEDECGGFSPARLEQLTQALQDGAVDHGGPAAGLTVCIKAAKVSQGQLRVHNVPGKGCVFTLDLPRKTAPAGLTVIEGGKSTSAARPRKPPAPGES